MAVCDDQPFHGISDRKSHLPAKCETDRVNLRAIPSSPGSFFWGGGSSKNTICETMFVYIILSRSVLYQGVFK